MLDIGEGKSSPFQTAAGSRWVSRHKHQSETPVTDVGGRLIGCCSNFVAGSPSPRLVSHQMKGWSCVSLAEDRYVYIAQPVELREV